MEHIEIESQIDVFCEQVSKSRELWILASADGGILSVNSAYDEEQDVLLVWHDESDARAQAQQKWTDFSAVNITLEEYLEDLAPDLAEDNILMGVNFSDDGCAEISTEKLVSELNTTEI